MKNKVKITKSEFDGTRSIRLELNINGERHRIDIYLEDEKNDFVIYGLGVEKTFLNGKMQKIINKK